jgi:predicted nuclease of predicted toxin-antitoxin system
VTSYKFLFDHNCSDAAQFFPKRRRLSLKQAGLAPDATDRQIVERASERRWVIVTVNGDDFIDEITRYLRQTKKLQCHDLSGLVILPSGHEVQRRVLAQVERKLILEGRRIEWKDVWNLDCCVRVTRDGRAQVSRFERCFYCKKNGLE